MTVCLILSTYGDACYELEPRARCAPDDVNPVPGFPDDSPPGNGCQQLIYHPHGYANYCLDISSLEDYSGYQLCYANEVTVYINYKWYHC